MNNPGNPDNAPLLDHEADGIKELDNLLPRWWVWLFYGTILFSAIYVGYYHVFAQGDLQAAEYDKEWKRGEAIKAASVAKFEATLGALTPSSDAAVLGRGREQYTKLCAPCHRPDGGGLVGPNLCDTFWIHGSNYLDSLKIIINGVPEKGMLTWRGVLNPGDIQAVASYIYTLRGTKPKDPKPPENQTGPEKPNIYE